MSQYASKRNEFIKKVTQIEEIDNNANLCQENVNIAGEIWNLESAVKAEKIPKFLLDLFMNYDFFITSIFTTREKDKFIFSIMIVENEMVESGIFETKLNQKELILIDYQYTNEHENGKDNTKINISNYNLYSILNIAKRTTFNILFNPNYNFYLQNRKRVSQKDFLSVNFTSIDDALSDINQNCEIKESSRLAKDLKSKYNIQYLFHMTDIKNLSSIFTYGLSCHIGAHQIFQVNKVNISNQNVQNQRSQVKIFDIPLHSFVSLYFNPKNPMLYSLKDKQENIAFLFIKSNIFESDLIVFSDGNAASCYTKFYSDLDDLDKVKWDIIWAKTWHDKQDGKRIRCAEALVLDSIPAHYINNISCYSQDIKSKIESTIPKEWKIEINVNKHLYF